MFKVKHLAVVGLITLSVVAPASHGQATAAVTDNVARMDEVVQSYADTHKFMGSVLVARDGHIVFDKGYGFANLEWAIPDAPDTKYRLGSLSKQFTAACILMLEEQGKLKLEDPVGKYLADAPAAWSKITLYNLLTHTSGIPNYTELPDFAAQNPLPTTPDQLIKRFRDKPLDFQPGEQWHYSNSNYAVLGQIIEKVSGKPYAAFVQANLFDRLGMKDSGYDSHSRIIAHRASGYSLTKAGPQNADYVDMSVPYAAGGLYSTTHDLLRWEEALFGGEVVSAASLKKMTTPFKANYGLGLMILSSNGQTAVLHAGGIQGFSTDLAYYPDEKLTIVVLGNMNTDAPSVIRSQLAAITHGKPGIKASDHKEVPIKPELLASYVGVYQIAPGFTITISLDNGHLTALLTGQKPMTILPESDTLFFLEHVDAQIEFVKAPDGTISLVLHQGGQDIKGTRKT